MRLIESYISKNESVFPELRLYVELIENAKANLTSSPDISIECSRALFEAIAKILIKHFLGANFREKDFNGTDSHKLIQQALVDLSEHIDDYEPDFIKRTVSVVNHVAEIRNARCEVAHGRILPKEQQSSEEFASLILNICDALSVYMLQSLEKAIRKEPADIAYKDNPEFNEMLDDSNSLGGKLLYSKALYDQDYIAYEELLDAYLM